jgi:hypothetical protein
MQRAEAACEAGGWEDEDDEDDADALLEAAR